MKTTRLAMSLVVLVAACQDSTEPPGSLELGGPLASISDALHNSGNQFFFFLPPMVPNPNATGVFDGSLAPEVEICEWTGSSCAASLATSCWLKSRSTSFVPTLNGDWLGFLIQRDGSVECVITVFVETHPGSARAVFSCQARIMAKKLS